MSSAPPHRVDVTAIAREMTGALLGCATHSPIFQTTLLQLSNFAVGTVAKITEDAEKIADYALARSASIDQTGIAMGQLQALLSRLDPGEGRIFFKPKKLFGVLPRKSDAGQYFDRFRRDERAIETALTALDHGRDRLLQGKYVLENIRIKADRHADDIQKAGDLCAKIMQRLVKLSRDLAQSDPEKSHILLATANRDVRSHQANLLQSAALAQQNRLLIDLLNDQNDQLIRQIGTSISATISALKTAIVASKAITNQYLGFGHIAALRHAVDQEIAQLDPNSAEAAQRIDDLHAELSAALQNISDFDRHKVEWK